MSRAEFRDIKKVKEKKLSLGRKRKGAHVDLTRDDDEEEEEEGGGRASPGRSYLKSPIGVT